MGADWDAIAVYLGYQNEFAMLYDLYVNKKLSAREIAERVDMGLATVLRRIRIAGIPTNARGGAQSSQRLWYKLHLLDQRMVFFTGMGVMGKKLRCSASLVYKYKRAMRGSFNGLLSDSADVDVREVSEQA